MSAITTHVLDTSRGRPAIGVSVVLERRNPNDTWTLLGRGMTDTDGRLRTLLPSQEILPAGTYKLTFDTETYFATLGIEGFYPEAAIVFSVRKAGEHYHVPLLLNPFGYSTYRGS
jgi:5-hydroxyisourate hydrolase